MKKGILGLAVLLVIASDLRAQATVTITSAGPGTNNGDLDVAGTYTVDGANGWMLGAISVTIWPVGGGEAISGTANVHPNTLTWDLTFAGLTSGANFNVSADIGVNKAGGGSYHA